MPTLFENKRTWNETYDWAAAGDEWSGPWGSPDMQWHWSILPRIRRYVPTRTIIEIAPGFGRWTQFLIPLCQNLVLVDLAEKCIDACRKRFADASHITYHINDGRSLEMVADDSVDFAFSFDSLVHAEEDVLAGYLAQLGRKLTANGVAFLHHSNLGQFQRYVVFHRTVERICGRWSGLIRLLTCTRLLDASLHWRASTCSAQGISEAAAHAGLICVGQEKVNWRSRRLIDCFSTLRKGGSHADRAVRVVDNGEFMNEAKRARRLACLYADGERLDGT